MWSFFVRIVIFIGVTLVSAYAESGPRMFTVLPKSFPVGPNPCAIAIADLTDNGLLDIVTADRGQLHDVREERPANDEISLLIAEKPFAYTRKMPSLKAGFAPYALTIANVDGLKYPDIISVNFLATRNRHVTVFLNLKDEGIFSPLEFKMPEKGLNYYRHLDGDGMPLFAVPGLTSVAVRDINSDGLRDLVATGWSSDVIVVMKGSQDTVFGEPTFILLDGAPRALALSDLDGDGDLDLAVALYVTSEIALLRGDSRGNFEVYTRFKSRGSLPTAIHVNDMNNDGRPDIIVSHCHTDDSIVIFYGGEKPFDYAVSQEIVLGNNREELEHEIRDFVVADLNGTGRMDIAAACYGSASVILMVNHSSDAPLIQKYRMETYRFGEGKPRALRAADFDNDGKPDLAVALWGTNSVALMRNVRQ